MMMHLTRLRRIEKKIWCKITTRVLLPAITHILNSHDVLFSLLLLTEDSFSQSGVPVHIRTDQSPKTTFLDSRDLKTYVSGEISTSKI